MKVSQLMTKKLISVRTLDSVEEAVRLLRQRGVRHLLVLDKNQLTGIVSDRDIKRALEPGKTRKRVMSVGGLYFLLEPILVEEIMTPDPVTIGPGESVQEAAKMMLEHRFGALPVVQNGRPVGIITETDLLRYFVTSEEQPAKKTATTKKSRKRPVKARG